MEDDAGWQNAAAQMCRKNQFARICLKVAALTLAASSCNTRALTPSTVELPGSTTTVESAPSTNSGHAPRPYVSRTTLTAAETRAPMMFEVALKMRHFSELEARINRGEQIDQQEMAAKYEPLAADYEIITAWLKKAGFTIVRSDPHHVAIFARGAVAQVAAAFGVTFARVMSDGKEYTSAITAPHVPGEIASLIIGINGLQPHLHAHTHLIMPQARPNATTGGASYFPSQIAQAYGASALYNVDITGAGQTIAIVIDTFPSTTDLIHFWTNASVNQSIGNIAFIQAVPGPLPTASAGLGEETLDTEWSSSIAPGARVRVYATTELAGADLDLAYQRIYDDVTNHPELGIHQMSMSYGEGETYTTKAQVDTDDQYFMELTAAGVSVFASSGDGGATPGAGVAHDESGPLQVESPASDPYVTAVGGTSLVLDSNNNETGEVVWNNGSGASGGGASEYFPRPSWQTGPNVPASTARLVPDISCAADPNHGASIYFDGAETTVGGTSWSSPTCAGFCALINQARANAGLAPLGALNPKVYAVFNSAAYATAFRDIATGNNATATSGTTGGVPNYTAQAGYDEATGIGSPLTLVLAQNLVGSSTLIGVGMPAAMASIRPQQSATFTVAVGGSTATCQWQRKPIGSTTWTSLSDNLAYSGSGTNALTVTGATPAMSGDQFHCLVTLGNNVTITTEPSSLVVETPLVISTLAGTAGVGGLVDQTPGSSAEFNIPSGIGVDPSGNLFIADYSNNVIREVTPGGAVSTPYGNNVIISGVSNKGSADGSGNNASFYGPNGVAVDSAGDIYVADTSNNLIRKISSGLVSTFASGFNTPEGVAVDGFGNVYVADTGNDMIWEISPEGVATPLAGIEGSAGYQDGAAIGQAIFNSPTAVAVDGSGNVYVTDFGNSVVRKISGGQVTTIAGQAGVAGYLDGPGGLALFNTPAGVAVDGAGNVYVADCLVPALGTNAAGNDLVRKISASGAVSTLAGQPGNEGSADGTGTGAQFYSVQGIALNPATGTIYLADAYNQTIRMGVPEAPPVISLAATVATAVVYGSIAGRVTVTRSGDTSAALSVDYSLSGTAVANTDYTALPGIVTIPAGAASAVIVVDPLPNLQASNPTLRFALNSVVGYAVGSPSSATLTILEATPYQTWAVSAYGANATNASVNGLTADPRNNGVSNLLEYAFRSNSIPGGTEGFPVVSTVPVGNQEFLALTYTVNASDPNLTYTVQVTGDLTGQTDQWHSGSAYTTLVPSSGTTTQVTVRDNTPISAGAPRFIRVQVSGD